LLIPYYIHCCEERKQQREEEEDDHPKIGGNKDGEANDDQIGTNAYGNSSNAETLWVPKMLWWCYGAIFWCLCVPTFAVSLYLLRARDVVFPFGLCMFDCFDSMFPGACIPS
jgi:hypothetical protein